MRKLSNDETRNYFDLIASTRGINSSANADKYCVIRALLADSKTHERLLECGGGGGFYTRRFLADGYLVTCVDLSEKAINENREQALRLGYSDRINYVNGDFVKEVPSFGRQFDQVVFIKVLHHFPSLSAIEAAIAAGLQACKSGGRLVIFEPNGSNILWRIFLGMMRDKESGRSKWFFEQNLRFTTAKNLSRTLDSNGVKYTLRYHYVIPGYLVEKSFRGLGFLRLINRLLERSALKKLAFNISYTVEKQ